MCKNFVNNLAMIYEVEQTPKLLIYKKNTAVKTHTHTHTHTLYTYTHKGGLCAYTYT